LSRDVQLGWNCPHLVLEERIALSGDRRELVTLNPVANDGIVALIANNEVEIPRDGLYAYAKLVSFQAGPYTLIENENDLSIVTSTENFSLTLPAATFLTADEVALAINRASPSKKTLASSERGRLTITDLSSIGPRSIVQVFGGSLPKLNLNQQSGAQGRMVYPPWQLYSPPVTFPNGNYTIDPATAENSILLIQSELAEPSLSASKRLALEKQLKKLQDYVKQYKELLGLTPTRYPRFVQPVSGNPMLSVSYVTSQNRCIRCRGSGVENDYRFTTTASLATNTQPSRPAGSVYMVKNEDLLYQAALKIVLTTRGSNPFHPAYGSTVLSRIGSKAVTATAAAINQDVRRALRTLQDTQTSQARYQPVTARERLYAVQSVEVTPDQYDPTVYYVAVTVQNASTAPISLNIVYATSGVFSRSGNLTLGNQAFGGSAWP